jgi:hypothetical protein
MTFESRLLLRRPDSYVSGDADGDNPQWWNGSQIVAIMLLTSLMAVGELAALIGVYVGRQSALADGLVWVGLVAGLAGVVGPVLGHQRELFRRYYRATAPGGILVPALMLICSLVIVATVVGFFVAVRLLRH